jgi:hypothetical protein
MTDIVERLDLLILAELLGVFLGFAIGWLAGGIYMIMTLRPPPSVSKEICKADSEIELHRISWER